MDSIIGNRQLDMEVLKEPRGFLRCLQWFFAMLAFATCCDFSTRIAFDIVCKNNTMDATQISTVISYPFKYVLLGIFYIHNSLMCSGLTTTPLSSSKTFHPVG